MSQEQGSCQGSPHTFEPFAKVELQCFGIYMDTNTFEMETCMGRRFKLSCSNGSVYVIEVDALNFLWRGNTFLNEML